MVRFCIDRCFAGFPLLRKDKNHRQAGAPALPSMRITNKRVYGFMILFGCVAAIFYAVTAWLAPLVQSMGMSSSQSGHILTLFTVIQIPVGFIIPVLVNKTGNRKAWLLLCSISEIIGIGLLLGQFSPWIAAVFLGIGE